MTVKMNLDEFNYDWPKRTNDKLTPSGQFASDVVGAVPIDRMPTTWTGEVELLDPRGRRMSTIDADDLRAAVRDGGKFMNLLVKRRI